MLQAVDLGTLFSSRRNFFVEFTKEMAHNACLRLSMGISSEIKVMAIAIEKTTILEVKATIALPF